MKRRLFTLIVCCCLGLISGKLFAQSSPISPPIPHFSFLNTDRQIITNKDIPPHLALLLVYFRTDCDDCRHIAQVIRQKASAYPLTIWMVSPNGLDNLSDFEYMVGLTGVKNVRVLQDNKSSMHKFFDFSFLPFVVLYNGNGREMKTYDYLPDVATVKKDLSKK